MSFLAPWALLLALAAGVPLLLHLLRRRTGARFDFPAVRYLLRAEREHSREVKLRNLLLMALRLAIVLALALAAARPLGRLVGAGHPPTAVVIVLDNSLSSAAATARGPVLQELIRAAVTVTDAANSGDRLWLVTADGRVQGGSASQIRDALSRTQPLSGAGSPAAALARGRAVLHSSALPAQQLVLLTDGQANSWPDSGAAPATTPLLLHQPAGDPPANRSVLSARAEPVHWNPTGTLRASVGSADSTTWRIAIEGRTIARGTVAAGATIVTRLSPSGRGWLAGFIELAPDELRGDDTRHFAVHLGDPPPVEVDPASGPFLAGAAAALVQERRAVRGVGVRLSSAESARRPGVIFAPADPLRLADANRALVAAGIPWRFGARREGPAPLRGAGLDGATAQRWFPLEALDDATADTIGRVGGAPWAVAGPGYVLVASAATADATDLPVRAAFVPWLDALVVGRLSGEVGTAADGVPGSLVHAPSGADALESPGGSFERLGASRTVRLPDLPGVHFWRRGDRRIGAIVVNPAPEESRLERHSIDRLAARLGGAMLEPDAAQVGARAFALGGRRTLDTPFLLLALLLLLVEAFIARARPPRPVPD